ncbi:MAG: DUF3108 domain-containing protein [Chitinophagaceae bacterium]
MNRILHTLLVATMALWSAEAHAQDDFCHISNYSFREGERLLFKVYYNMSPFWIHAGDAEFTIGSATISDEKVYHIAGTGKTLSSYDWFFKVRDKYETFLDRETLLPKRFVRNVDEGGVKFTNYVNFNHNAGKATSTNGTYNIPKCTQDVLSAIYFARNIDYARYKPGAKIPFSMFLDDQVYDLYIRYLGKEKIETKYGTFNAIKIAPLLIKGTIFKGGEKMTVWVTDDANHIPVRISSPIIVGSIKVDMMEFNNLKYPLSALVKRK